MSSSADKGLGRLITALADRKSALDRNNAILGHSRVWLDQERSFSWHHRIFSNQAQTCNSLRPANYTLQASSGPAQANRKPLRAVTEASQCDGMFSFAERNALRLMEGHLMPKNAKEVSLNQQWISSGLPGQHKSLSGK